MKLKLLFFMGILSVLFNTVSGQSNQPPFFGSGDPVVLRPPQNRVVCPGYTAANINYQTSDSNTFAEDLILNVSYVNLSGSQVVTFINAFETGGVNRTITVVPSFPYSESVVEVTISVTDVGSPTPNLTSTAKFTVTFQDDVAPTFTSTTPTDNDVSLDGNCNFEVPDYVSLLTLTAVDDCGGAVSLAQSPLAGVLLTGGHDSDQLIVLTATDLYGNVASQSFTITLKDTTPPVVITQDITVSLDGTGNVMITPSQIDNGSNDNCSSMASLTYSLDLSSFTCADIGPNTVTLMVTDAVGNSATNTATVTVVDDIAPSITCPANINVSNDLGECGAIVSSAFLVLVTDDNCGVTATSTTRSDSLLLTDAYPVGVTTITWTAEDSSGNISSCTQTVTVNDAENPVAVTKNITVELDAMGNATISVSDIEDGSTDNCGIVASLSMLDITSFDCDDLGANTVVLTVEDAAGNTDIENATVTVVDLLKPEITTSGDENVDNDLGQCGALVTVSATTTDNCTNPISASGVRFFNNVADGLLLTDEYPVGTTTIVWTATDDEGNVATATQTVTVNDVEAPTFSPLSDLTLNNDDGFCGYDINQLTFPNASDNCGTTSSTTYVINGDPSLTLIPVSVGPDHVPSTIVWTATDGNGNTATATQQILVRDLELPVMRTKDITRSFDANGQVVITAEDIDDGSTDNSGEACFTKYVVDNIIDCNEVGVHDVVLFGKDQWGNQHYSIAKVTTVDDTDPTFVDATIPAIDFNTNTACTWVGVLPIPATQDNCSVVSVTNDAPAAFDLGTTSVLWTVTDAAGNMATSTQDVTVTDAEKPVAIAKVGVIVELDTLGDATITALDIDNGSTDNCGIVASLSLVSPSTFTCANVGANVVILTVEDSAGNKSTVDTVVTVVDKIIPVIASVSPIVVNNSTGICGANIAVDAPLANDNCTNGSAVGTRSDGKLLTAVYPIGTTMITWNFSDVSGNAALAVTQTVDVADNEDPTITTTPIVVDTNAGCIWTGTLGLPVTADNCSVASVTSDKAADFAYPVGETTVIWTVTDLAGNFQIATQTVTVRDTEKPIAKATDITIKLSSLVGAGAATISVADIDNGSSDNCGIKSVTISKSSFDCNNVGKNTVVLTVTDNSISPIATGNVSTANAIVTVVDDILPVIAPVSPIVVNTTTGICGANLEVTPSATATDNCTVGTPVGTRSDARALSATYPLGRTTITWNVKDASGNPATPVIQTVDVTDNQVPVITTNGTRTANADLGGCSAVVTVSATATDNCGVGSPMGVRSDALPLASPYPVGTTTITWTVTDVNGNAAIAVPQTVTVTDTQRPVITANGNKNLVSDFGQCGAFVAVSATATDNCSVTNPVVGTRSDAAAINALYPVGTTTITWNVTDVNGNAATPVVQTVVVRDLQIPVINGTVVSIDANTDAAACGATVTVTPPSASDNCSVTAPVVGTRSDNLALTALYPIGSTTITWRVADVNGNIAIPTTTTVKVKDMVLPTVRTRNIPVELNVGGFATIVPAQVNDGSSDNCGIASYSLDKTSFNCSNVGANPVILTVIDIHGNVNFETATVTISEPVKPIARALTSVTLQLNNSGTVSVIPADLNNGSTDNCRIVSYALSKSSFDCSNVGQNIVNLTATDASGNVSDPVQVTIIVQDKVAPVVVTQAYTAILNAAGTVTITPANVNGLSTDNCAIATYSISKSTFTCDNVGENIITLTVTDVNGNSAQAFATVNVVDDIAPKVITKNIELVLVGDSVSITPEDVLVSATDACGVDVLSYRLSQDTFTIVDVLLGSVEITVYATDVNGNEGQATATITFPRVPAVANEVITPNGDGTNDTWVIDNITNHPNSIVKVYNTWGSLVFSATNYQNNWDGKLNGNDVTLPDGGSYYYQIDLDGNGSVEEQGWLYITRQ